MKVVRNLILGVLVLTGLHACYQDNAEDLYGIEPICRDVEQNYTWQDNVSPVISANCATPQCHGAGNNGGRVELIDFSSVKTAIDLNGLETRVKSGEMPPGGGIAPCDTAAIMNWIRSGYANN